MSIDSEYELVDAVAQFIAAGGFPVFREVALLGQSADLVVEKSGELFFVEAKINGIKRALQQCKAHELVADYICIAIGTKSVRPDNLAAVAAAGYGLISCSLADRSCVWLLEPKKLSTTWRPLRQKIYQRMVEGGEWPLSIG